MGGMVRVDGKAGFTYKLKNKSCAEMKLQRAQSMTPRFKIPKNSKIISDDPVAVLKEAHQKVLADIQHILATVNRLSSLPCTTAETGVGILDRLRKATYEDLNQIQHEHLIVRAAEWLLARRKCPPETQWFWNPRQTPPS